MATYVSSTTYFGHGDWLGTERARTDVNGAVCETIESLPFGDGMGISGSCADVSPMHFTGKQRDTETGLDNFGARYDASGLGRFMTPDWSATVEPVPYAKLGDPQSLDLYACVEDNPLTVTDPTGHCQPSDALACATIGMAAPVNISKKTAKRLFWGDCSWRPPTGGATLEAQGFAQVVGGLTTAGLVVTGTTKITAPNANTDSVKAVTNPAGFVTTLFTKSVEKGAAVAEASGVLKAVDNPGEVAKNLADAVLTLSEFAKSAKGEYNALKKKLSAVGGNAGSKGHCAPGPNGCGPLGPLHNK